MSREVPTEHVEAVRLMQCVRLHEQRHPELQCLTAIPNGGDRHGAVAAKMKAEGVRKGYPDYLLDVPRGDFHGLRIELKRLDASPSDTKPDQLAWHARLREHGYRVEVCKGWQAAWAVVCDYLSITNRIAQP
jgi:hypothetical protein